jgi:hypothetical protein
MRNLSDEEILLDHRIIHDWYGQGGSHGWDREDLLKYHQSLSKVMDERGISHEERDELDKSIKDIVRSPEWQSLRESLVGTWKESPAQNVQRLRKFLGSISDTSDDKLAIIHNYLTGSGFRSGNIQHEEVTKLLNQVRKERERRGST